MSRDSTGRYAAVLLAGIGCLAIAVYVSLTRGEYDMTVKEVFQTLFRIDSVSDYDLVLFQFRLPRIVIAALVGLGLGVAGCVLQGITGNGLADPGILGINAGAGAAIVIFMSFFQGHMTGAGWLAVMAMPLFGWAAGLIVALLIYIFSWKNGGLDPQRLLLVGIALGSGFGAMTLYLSLKMNPQDFETATVWLTGSIWNANWRFIAALLPWLVVFIPVVWGKAHLLDLFQLKEDSVKSLGIAANRERAILLICSVGIVSACVSVSGNVGFVGLLAPHIAKRLVGIRHARVIPVGGLTGMLLVVVSDFIGKTVFAPAELPVGIVIAMVGVPYFVYLLFKSKGSADRTK